MSDIELYYFQEENNYTFPRITVFASIAFVALCMILVLTAFPNQPVKAAPKATPTPSKEIDVISPSDHSQVQPDAITPDSKKFQECQVSPDFPQKILQWCGIITFYSKKNDLPPDLVAAVIFQESGGKVDAYSKSGAVGLMQVMPRDGIAAGFMCVNGPCFAQRPTIEELKNPIINIKYGTRMLGDLLRKYGSFREALFAYGPMNVGYSYADKVLAIYRLYHRVEG